MFVKPLDGIIVIPEGVSHTLECIATAEPSPDMFWYKDGTPLIHEGLSIKERYIFLNEYTRLVML